MSEPAVGSALSMHDPRQVGPWTIHSRLGAGGMGVVFYASSPGYEGAALKVIRPGLLDAPATRDRFRREVAILRSVHDAHISEFLAADLESEPAWLAIEYVAGPTLRDEIADNGPLSEDEWWKLARGMAQALAVLDKHRITHRDLKPGNVILGEHGPELIDFGIAHPEDATSLTATGLVTGSPSWLSPEQATLEPTGPPSDIFALGSLLAYAATGRPPFGEGASVAVLMSIATREPDLVGIDPNRSALLQRMLAKDPTRRPTARQVLDRLRGNTTGGTTLTDMPEPTIALGGAAAAATVANHRTSPAPPAPEHIPTPTPPAPIPTPVPTPPAPTFPPVAVSPTRSHPHGAPVGPDPDRGGRQHRPGTAPPSGPAPPATPVRSAHGPQPPSSAGPIAAACSWSSSSASCCWSPGGSSSRLSGVTRPTQARGSGTSTDAPPSASDAPPAPARTSSRTGTGCWRPTASTTPPTAWSSRGRCATPAAQPPRRTSPRGCTWATSPSGPSRQRSPTSRPEAPCQSR